MVCWPVLLLSLTYWVMCNSLMTSWTVACQAPLYMKFSRQEYWNGLPFPSPGDLFNPGIEPTSPALAGRFFTSEPPGESLVSVNTKCIYLATTGWKKLAVPLVLQNIICTSYCKWGLGLWKDSSSCKKSPFVDSNYLKQIICLNRAWLGT